MTALETTLQLMLAAAAALAASLAHAQPTSTGSGQAYPAKAIRLIVPNAPGGGTDTIARVISDRLSPALGQQIVVENRGGAGGRIAAEGVARAPKDGYTLLLGSAATLITGPALDADRKYDPLKDFAHISMAGRTAYMLVVHPSLPASDVRELVELERAQPRRITYASSGQGSPAHLGMELLQAMAKARFVHVPYKGGAPAMLSLFQGENFVMIANFLTALPAARASRVRALGVTSLARTRLAPDLPTIAENGLPGFELQQFYSLVAPAGIPADVVARLNHEMGQRFAAEDSRRRLDGEGVEVATSTAQEAAALYAAEYGKWARVIRDAGVRSE
jgi:tripartite-type tricarboxylate transporter receptor subunit TctC